MIKYEKRINEDEDKKTHSPLAELPSLETDFPIHNLNTTSNYFKQDLNAFEPNRAYKILIKVNHDDGQEIIYDNDFEFILRT